MEDFTAQDEVNIEVYNNMSTEALIVSIEALHMVKKGGLVDPFGVTMLYTVRQIEDTISLIREILIQRNAIQ